MSKYKQQPPKPQQQRPPQPPKPQQPSQQPKKPKLDFDSELIGRHATIKLLDGSTVQGVVTDNTRYWLRVLCGERVIFVHKAAIVLVEVSPVKK
ncbi:MAG: hypothetical protein QXU69_11280 [Thermofilaceae archaeon]